MAHAQHRKPLDLSGVLDKFSYEDTTPEIGREFLNVNIVDDIMKAENADELLRDLAITSESSIAPANLSVAPSNYLASKSPVGASSSSGLKPTSPMTCKRTSSTGWAG